MQHSRAGQACLCSKLTFFGSTTDALNAQPRPSPKPRGLQCLCHALLLRPEPVPRTPEAHARQQLQRRAQGGAGRAATGHTSAVS